MTVRKLNDGIYEVGAIDPDRELFDELVHLPNGTSYNAYIIKGTNKTALIDTVDPTKTNILLENIARLREDEGIEQIDYVIANHAEQDHSGSLPRILEAYPEARVVTNPKCKKMLMDLLPIKEEMFIEVLDGDHLNLGGRNLEFIYTPWVHWPETMCTYLVEEKTLFSCDFFGAHLASGELFADNVDISVLNDAAKRYYAEIMMPFALPIRKNLEKLASRKIDVIAPSHGPIHRKPAFIRDLYSKWSSESVENRALVAYVSMHGSTARMAEYLTERLNEKGVSSRLLNITETPTDVIAMELVDAASVVLASPMTLAGLHPLAASIAFIVNALRPKTRYLGFIGSFGWGGRMTDQLKSLIPNLRAELLEPVLVRGFPKEGDFQKLDDLAEEIARRHELIRPL